MASLCPPRQLISADATKLAPVNFASSLENSSQKTVMVDDKIDCDGRREIM